MNNLPTDPIHDEGQWISGAMGEPAPQFAPTALVFEVVDLLRGLGIVVDLTPAITNTASIAAADLLRALGVTPATAPRR